MPPARPTAGHSARYSVAVVGDGRGDQRRWPDLVLSTPAGCIAVELELTPKGTRRLNAIVAGYHASHYARVVFAVRGAALYERLARIAAASRPSSELRTLLALQLCEVTVTLWQGGRDTASALTQSLASGHAGDDHRAPHDQM